MVLQVIESYITGTKYVNISNAWLNFQINSMRVGALVCLIVVGWYQNLGGMSWCSIHCPWHQDELGVSGIEEKTGVTTVVICGYVRIGVCGCVWVVVLGVLLWGTICLCRVNKVVRNTVGFGVGWQRFGWPDGGECGVVGNNVPISVYDGCELFAYVWERGYNGRNIAAVGQDFLMSLMMRCSGYERPSRMRVRLLCSDSRIWSSEMIML